MNGSSIFILLIIQQSYSVIVKTESNGSVKKQAKKSVETLYTIEQDGKPNVNSHPSYYAKEYPQHFVEAPVRNIPANVIDPAHLLLQQQHALQQTLTANPLLAALLLSQTLGLPALPHVGYNHPQHLSLNPYVALLLSHYGRYVQPINRQQRGIYGYSAANNYHNNKPFGSYKIYEDQR